MTPAVNIQRIARVSISALLAGLLTGLATKPCSYFAPKK